MLTSDTIDVKSPANLLSLAIAVFGKTHVLIDPAASRGVCVCTTDPIDWSRFDPFDPEGIHFVNVVKWMAEAGSEYIHAPIDAYMDKYKGPVLTGDQLVASLVRSAMLLTEYLQRLQTADIHIETKGGATITTTNFQNTSL